ncbi:MAG: amidohydrolase [Chloroflexota bacterium]|nr:MAG: amidohydrolase [Chloroflexota bacterium]
MHHELLLYNARIHPLATPQPVADAILLRGGRVAAVGRRQEIPALSAGRRETLDLRGRCVLPGFIDAHIHLLALGLFRRRLQLAGCRFLGECLERVRTAADSAEPGEWILGGGWDRNLWGTGAPSRESLDLAAPRNPVALSSKDLHALWLNSEGLRLVGIRRDSPNPPGGLIERDALGEPTGILKEAAAITAYMAADRPSPATCQSALRDAIAELQRLGVTSVHVPEDQRTWHALQTLRAAGALGLRVYMLPPASSLPHLAALGLHSGFGDEFLRLGPIKVFADGSLGTQTAALLRPYQGRQDRGVSVTPRRTLRKLAERGAAAGIALAVHAIGDRAVRNTLDALETAKAVEGRSELRHRLEHLQLVDPRDLPRIARLGVVASVQPLHAVSDRALAETYWGERCAHAYPYHSLLSAGAVLAGGSDAPVESPNPLLGIRAAVTRRQAASEEPWHPEQRLSVIEALRTYTWGGAFASGEEQIKGTLEPGRLADLVVLSDDIFSMPPDSIGDLTVVGTIVGGEVVWTEGFGTSST